MKKSEHLDWALFAVRLMVGSILVLHGGQKILEHLGYAEIHGLSLWTGGYGGIICLAPLTELLGGGLILSGIMIELGALLVVPAILFAIFIANLNTSLFIPQGSYRFFLNLIMLAIVVGICGPGKWALWDPGKSFRKKIF